MGRKARESEFLPVRLPECRPCECRDPYAVSSRSTAEYGSRRSGRFATLAGTTLMHTSATRKRGPKVAANQLFATTLRHRNHDLPEMLVGAHQCQRLRDLLQRERPIDRQRQPA